jgi:hypothetical protein
VASDDWRIRIEVEDEEHAHGVLHRLGLELHEEAADLARDLELKRLAVSRDDNLVFVYAGSRADAEAALAVVDAQLRAHEIEAKTSRIEHWLADEDRWDDEPADTPDIEEEELEEGFAPWEVRVECKSHHEADQLADRLEREGQSVVRRWQYVIVGASSKEDAEALAKRLQGEVEPGGELVWDTLPPNIFTVFGGLGGSGTPL